MELSPGARRLQTIIPVAACLVVLTCNTPPRATEDDHAKLSRLRSRFGDRYQFQLETDTYVSAMSQQEVSPSREEGRHIFEEFWLEGGMLRTSTNYVYLNVYGSDGLFSFQIYWDARDRQVQYSATEYY